MSRNGKDAKEAEATDSVSNVLQFPSGETAAYLEDVIDATLSGLSLTPLQLLGFILKIVLQDRITDAEVDLISTSYYDTVRKWFT